MANDVSAFSVISSPQQAVNLCLNNLLDGDLCTNTISFIFIFYLPFCFLNMILSDALILPVSQLQTQQEMRSQIRSHIEYLIQT